MEGAAIAGFIVGLIIGGTLGALIGALILRAAIGLYNKMAGPASSVTDPPFGKALVIVIVTMLANLMSSFMLGLAIGFAGAAAGIDPNRLGVIAQLASIPVGLLVMALMIHVMLPTTFVRGLLVALCYALIVIVLAIVIGMIIFLVTAATA
jgi:hypothetical protein